MYVYLLSKAWTQKLVIEFHISDFISLKKKDLFSFIFTLIHRGSCVKMRIILFFFLSFIFLGFDDVDVVQQER